MPTIEERLQTLEQEHTALKKTIELQTIAIGALVNKATLEKLNDKYDRLFETLITHDHFTNEQLAEIRTQQTEEDGKIVGLQTEMRQRFSQVDTRFDKIEGDIVLLKGDVSTLKDDATNIKATMATKEDIVTVNENMAAMENRILDAFKQLSTMVNPQHPTAE